MFKEGTSVVKEITSTAPPLTITVYSFMGLPIQQWVYVLTALYTLFQVVRLLPKMYGCVICFYKYGTCKRTCKEGFGG